MPKIDHDLCKFSVFFSAIFFSQLCFSFFMSRDFRKMQIWHLAYNLVLDIYPLLEHYPEFESRNVVDQIRRCVTSLPLNIAEGAGSNSNKVFFTYLSYAYKSAKELDVLLQLSHDLSYLDDEMYAFLKIKHDEFIRRLFRFILRIEAELEKGNRKMAYLPPDTADSRWLTELGGKKFEG